MLNPRNELQKTVADKWRHEIPINFVPDWAGPLDEDSVGERERRFSLVAMLSGSGHKCSERKIYNCR